MKLLGVAALAALSLVVAREAGAQRFGDWHVTRIDGYSDANTTNASGSTIGYLCVGGFETCGPYLLIADVTCEEKAVYPLMINSPVGGFHATATCGMFGAKRYMAVNEVEIFNQAVESGGEIGIAFPMQSGKFNVSRFSTSGSLPAIRAATSAPPDKRSNAKSLRDQSL